MTITTLDVLQAIVCAATGYAAICRLHKLQLEHSVAGAVVAQMAVLFGSCVQALGWALPPPLRDPATVPSLVFSCCVLVCILAGARRWRGGAPAGTRRPALDDSAS